MFAELTIDAKRDVTHVVCVQPDPDTNMTGLRSYGRLLPGLGAVKVAALRVWRQRAQYRIWPL